jgi:hypothetical protein
VYNTIVIPTACLKQFSLRFVWLPVCMCVCVCLLCNRKNSTEKKQQELKLSIMNFLCCLMFRHTLRVRRTINLVKNFLVLCVELNKSFWWYFFLYLPKLDITSIYTKKINLWSKSRTKFDYVRNYFYLCFDCDGPKQNFHVPICRSRGDTKRGLLN